MIRNINDKYGYQVEIDKTKAMEARLGDGVLVAQSTVQNDIFHRTISVLWFGGNAYATITEGQDDLSIRAGTREQCMNRCRNNFGLEEDLFLNQSGVLSAQQWIA